MTSERCGPKNRSVTETEYLTKILARETVDSDKHGGTDSARRRILGGYRAMSKSQCSLLELMKGLHSTRAGLMPESTGIG